MARIYERFKVPSAYAGKVEGRSSFARLGLMVHCTGDFINPGWGGYMPLQLYNAGPFSIRIYPYLDICQLKVVKLTKEPDRSYGEEDLQSKYVNDDGGPSYWWRDIRVRRSQEQMGRINLDLRIRKEIVDLVRFEDPDLLEHFEQYILKQRVSNLENADAILDSFSEREDVRRWIDRIGEGLFPALALASIGAWFEKPLGTAHGILFAVTAPSIVWFLYSWFWRPAEYLGSKELAAIRRQRAGDTEAVAA
jgi:dUTPase